MELRVVVASVGDPDSLERRVIKVIEEYKDHPDSCFMLIRVNYW